MKRTDRLRSRSLPPRRWLALTAALLWTLPGLLPAAPRPGTSRPPVKSGQPAARAVKPDKGSTGDKPDITVQLDPGGGVPSYTEQDCISLAARNNPDVLAAAKRVDAARAAIVTAKAPIYPALTTTGYYQRREQSIANGGQGTATIVNGQTVIVNSDFNRTSDYYGDVRVSQNLYSGGAVRNRIAATKLQAQAASFDLDTQLDATTLTVRTAFLQTLYAEANIAVRQQAVDLLGAQLKDQQDRLAAGSVGQLNVNRFQIALANERPVLLDAQAALGTAYSTLAQALGVGYQTGSLKAPFRVRGTLDTRPMSMTLGECLERAYAMRPEIRSKQFAIDALKRQVAVEKSGTRPQVTAYAAYDLYSEPDIRTVDDYYSGYTLGVTASWTIFDGFATRGRVRSAQAQVGEAEASLSSTRKQVENEVYDAYTDLHTAEGSLRPLSDNIRLATETLDLTTHNFDAGLSTQLDVLQSRVDLTRSRSGELAGRLAFRMALARLERAMALGRPTQGSATTLPAQ